MFNSYFAAQTSFVHVAGKPIGLSMLLHGLLALSFVVFPLAHIRSLPPPMLSVEIFEAAPPPPPPPAGSKTQEQKEIVKPKEPDALVEPDKKQEVKPEEQDKGEEAGVDGGVEGGVVGGVVGGVLDSPAQILVNPQRKLSGDPQQFPIEAKTQGLQANIAARICIAATGEVTNVKILRGLPIFSDAVQKAVMKWRYEPYRAAGSAIPACFPVYFNFNLRD